MSDYNTKVKANSLLSVKSDSWSDKHEKRNRITLYNESQTYEKRVQDAQDQYAIIQQQCRAENPDQVISSVVTPHTNVVSEQAKKDQEQEDEKSCSIDHEHNPQK